MGFKLLVKVTALLVTHHVINTLVGFLCFLQRHLANPFLNGYLVVVVTQHLRYLVLNTSLHWHLHLLGKLVTHGNVFGLLEHVTVSIRLCKVLVATPQDVAKLVVGDITDNTLIVFQAKGFKHIQESPFDLVEPVVYPWPVFGILKFGVLSQLAHILFGSFPHIAIILVGQLVNAVTNLEGGTLIGIIKEGVIVAAKQLSQSMVGYTLMKDGLYNIRRATVVAHHNDDAIRLRIIPALGILLPGRELLIVLQLVDAVNNRHLVAYLQLLNGIVGPFVGTAPLTFSVCLALPHLLGCQLTLSGTKLNLLRLTFTEI